MLKTPPRCSAMALLLCVAALGLSSCKLVSKNYTVVTELITPPQEDDVVVETPTGEVYVPPASQTVAAAPSAPSAPQQAAGGGGTIIVQPGETLSGIAARNGVSLSALLNANNMTLQQADLIRAGQQLVLPGRGSSVAAAPAQPVRSSSGPAVSSGVRSYTVRRGETLSGIAARNGVSSAALMKANNLTPQQADRIREGQTLRIPAR